MRAALRNHTVVEYIYPISILDGRQSVRDRDCGSALCSPVESLLDDLFRLRVEGRSCFIQESKDVVSASAKGVERGELQNLGVSDEGSSDGDSLLLATREERAF